MTESNPVLKSALKSSRTPSVASSPRTTSFDSINIVKVVSVTSLEDRAGLLPAPEREKWGSKMAYFLTLVGYAVGFGNIWRFPYQMRENGGLAFLIPYCIMLAVLGIPIFFLELAVGQRRRKGVVTAWAEICPELGGIGIACGWLCFLVGIYYNTLIAYCLSYFFDSFKNPLPWTNCDTVSYDQKRKHECEYDVSNRSTKYYWFRQTLDISSGYEDIGNFNGPLFLYLILSWMSIYAILIKGTQSVGAVVYVTAVFPYIVLSIFFVANCVIEPQKAWLGAYRLLKPDWAKLLEPITWLKAGSQIFFSLSLAEGCLVVFSSYNPVRNNCHKDAVNISLINCSTSVFAAIVVFPMIGALGHRKYEECYKQMAALFPNSLLAQATTFEKKYDIYFLTKAKTWTDVSPAKPITIGYRYGELTDDEKSNWRKSSFDKTEIITQLIYPFIDKTLEDMKLHRFDRYVRDCSIGKEATASGEGTGFVFMGFTEAVKQMPGSNFWAVLFFLMLLTLGIDSGFATVEGVVAAIQDLTHVNRQKATGIVCAVMMTLGCIIFPFGWGSYVLDFLDQWAANWTYLLIALFECVAVAWYYGLAKMSYDVLLMTGCKPSVYILLCWKYFSPILISLLLIGSIIEFIYTSSINEHGFTYHVFDTHHPDNQDGDADLPMPVHILTIGFLIMIFCISFVPIHYCMRNTRWNMLREESPAEFPEEELREERNIHVTRESQNFSETEKAIMGKISLLDLQKHRDGIVRSHMSLKMGASEG